MRLTGLVILLTLALDQISKVWVVWRLGLAERGDITVLPGLLNFRMAWNRGMNFGLLRADADTGRWIFIGIALGVCAGVMWWTRADRDWRVQVSVGMLVGGALGNVIDRLLYGAVADFLNVTCCGIDNPWSFNVGDAGIFLGALGLLFWAGRGSGDGAQKG